MKENFLCVGVMTGNSLDAVDVVLTAFNGKKIEDICAYSQDIPQQMADDFRSLKKQLMQNGGDIEAVYAADRKFFENLHNAYVELVADTIKKMFSEYDIDNKNIDAVGFHGQTCYHFPPSVAGENAEPNTLQIGSGQMLSDLLNLPVVSDFRSDDIVNGGEGAPLAPVHNRNLAENLKRKGIYPAVFCNGGNTGNIAVVYNDRVCGWDTGPFNHFVDLLVRQEKGEACDWNGQYGRQGQVDFELLREMFEQCALTSQGQNFIEAQPPKSSDPAWYKLTPMMTDRAIAFADRLRTAEFFSAYCMAYNLSFLPIVAPDYFLVFGGGWNNPLIFADFEALLHGKAEVLPEHQTVFAKIKNENAVLELADKYGCNGKYMEARIFADMARCRLQNVPFSFPETTGCSTPTIAGIVSYPNGNDNRLWSRAAKGWSSI